MTDMSNRYKTAAEIEGARRRTEAHRARLREQGYRPREVWLSDPENKRLKEVVKHWRGEESFLSEDQAKAADILKPGEGDA